MSGGQFQISDIANARTDTGFELVSSGEVYLSS